MNRVQQMQPRMAILALAALLFGLAAAPVSAQIIKRVTFEDSIKQADVICIATCIEKKTEMRDGFMVTRYRMKPYEFWKGTMTLSDKGDFPFEELGGTIEAGSFGLAQRTPGQVRLEPGQQVLMVAQTVDRARETARLNGKAPVLSLDSPRLVAPTQGRGVYSVVSDPETGAKLVIAGTAGASADPAKVRKVFEEFQKQEQARLAAAPAVKGSAVAQQDQELAEPPRVEKMDQFRQRVQAVLDEQEQK